MILDQKTQTLLDSRTGRLPFHSYKLMEGQYGMDSQLPDVLDLVEGEMSVTFPFADGRSRDGVGDLLEIGGIRTDRHIQNPVILLDHGKYVPLPIGLAEDPKTKQYTVSIDPVNQVASVKAFFYQDARNSEHALLCEQLFDLMSKRYLRAGSIGYQVIAAKELGPNYDSGTPKGLHLLSVLMLEASIVVMPANKDTVRKALDLPSVCGKPLSPMLVKSLSPYLPEKKAFMATEKVEVPLNQDLSTTNVPPVKWKPGVGAVKDFAPIRQKYKRVKGLRRTMKKSSPGTAVIYVRNKNLQEAKKLASAKGLKFSHLGSHKNIQGLEKIKLIGDDGAIDDVAKQYGMPIKTKRTGIKFMANTKTKDISKEQMTKVEEGNDLEDEVPEEMHVDDDVPEQENIPAEKLSAQFLRRAHQDLRLLMQDYDGVLGLVEHEPIAKWGTGVLEGMEGHLSEIEGLFGEHHPDLPPLDGGEKDLDTSETKGGDVEESPEGEDTDSVPADSSEDEDEEKPEPEEAVEGMGIKMLSPAKEKQLRNKYKKCMKEPNVGLPGPCPGKDDDKKPGKPKPKFKPKENPKETVGKKSMCKDCGKPNCSCGKKNFDGEDTEEETKEGGHENPHGEEKTEGDDPKGESQGGDLQDHEKSMVKEAHGFLKELGTTNSFGEEHRMKSYHYHKCMEGIASVVNQAGTKDASGMEQAGTEQVGMEENNLHPHRKACKDASGFFQRLSQEKAFGEPHRQEAMALHKAMEEMAGDSPDEDATGPNPGVDAEMANGNTDEKNKDDHEELDYHKHLIQRDKQLEELNKRISSLVSLV